MASKRFRDAVGIDPDRIVSAAVEAALGEGPSPRKKHHPGRVLAAGAAIAAAAAVGQRRLPRLAKVPLRMGLHKLGDMAHVDELADAVRDRADAVRDRLTGDADQHDDDEYYDDEEELDDEDFDDEELDDEDFDDEPRDEAEDLPEDEDSDDGFDDEDDEGFDDEPEDDGGPRGEGEELDDDEALDDEEPEEDDEPRDEEEDEEPEAVEDEEDLEPEEDEDLEPDEDEDLEPDEDEDLEPDEDEDEQVAARSLELGLPGEANGHRARGRVPDLFEALRTPHRRAPVMRRDSLRVDPATRPPKPDKHRSGERRQGRGSKNTKSTAARS